MGIVKFTIPQNCHEDWQNMTASDQGRFCLSCKKDVVDFSSLNDREVFDIILKGDGNVCGRFSAVQINPGINEPDEKKRYWHKYFFSALLPALFVAKQSGAQTGKIDRRALATHQARMKKMIMPLLDRAIELSGKVVDSNTNEPIGLATITLRGTSNGIIADDEGNFKLRAKSKTSAITVRITAIGYEPEEIEIAVPVNDFILTEEKFYLKKQVMRLDEVTMRATTNYLSGTVGLFYMSVKVNRLREIPIRLKTAITDSIKISPDPVIRGNSLKVSLKLKQRGSHTIQVIDMAGRIIFQRSIDAVSKSHTEQINCGAAWNAGIYNIRIIGPGKQPVSSTRFLVK